MDWPKFNVFWDSIWQSACWAGGSVPAINTLPSVTVIVNPTLICLISLKINKWIKEHYLSKYQSVQWHNMDDESSLDCFFSTHRSWAMVEMTCSMSHLQFHQINLPIPSKQINTDPYRYLTVKSYMASVWVCVQN